VPRSGERSLELKGIADRVVAIVVDWETNGSDPAA
jgi:hypothetical protein